MDRQGRPCALLRVPGQRPSTSRTASTAPPAQPPSPRPAAPDSTDAAPTRPGGPGGARGPRGCPAAGGRPASRAPVVIPARRRARSRWCAPPGCRERPPAPAGGRPRAGGRGSERQATTTRTPKTPRTPTAIAPGPSRPAASRPGTSSRPRQGVRAKRVGSSGSAPAPNRARNGQARVTAAMASVRIGPRARAAPSAPRTTSRPRAWRRTTAEATMRPVEAVRLRQASLSRSRTRYPTTRAHPRPSGGRRRVGGSAAAAACRRARPRWRRPRGGARRP